MALRTRDLWKLGQLYLDGGRFGGRKVVPEEGSGGNAVFLLPEKRAVVVITTTNFNERQSHALTRMLLTRELIPLL